MIATKLTALAASIATANPYFDKHFADVVFDETTGYVFSDPKTGEYKPVFPNDTFGNYFYLRLPRNWGFQDFLIADDATGTMLTGQVVLVAYMRDADPDKLAANLINTLRVMGCGGHNIQLQTATAQNEVVILQELTGLSAENQESALQRMGNDVSLVSITFTYSTVFPLNTCITTPCKTC